MARWILLGLAVLGFGLSFAAKTPGILGLGLLLGLIGLGGFVVSMAAARVSAAARPETMMASIEDHSLLGRPRTPIRPPTASPASVTNRSPGMGTGPDDRETHAAAQVRQNRN